MNGTDDPPRREKGQFAPRSGDSNAAPEAPATRGRGKRSAALKATIKWTAEMLSDFNRRRGGKG